MNPSPSIISSYNFIKSYCYQMLHGKDSCRPSPSILHTASTQKLDGGKAWKWGQQWTVQMRPAVNSSNEASSEQFNWTVHCWPHLNCSLLASFELFTAGLISRPSHRLVFECLQYAKWRGKACKNPFHVTFDSSRIWWNCRSWWLMEMGSFL